MDDARAAGRWIFRPAGRVRKRGPGQREHAHGKDHESHAKITTFHVSLQGGCDFFAPAASRKREAAIHPSLDGSKRTPPFWAYPPRASYVGGVNNTVSKGRQTQSDLASPKDRKLRVYLDRFKLICSGFCRFCFT